MHTTRATQALLTTLTILTSGCDGLSWRSISGTVTDSLELRGSVVEGARILLFDDLDDDLKTVSPGDPRPEMAMLESRAAASGTTDENGFFRVDGLADRSYDALIVHRDYFVAHERISKREQNDIELELEPFAFDVSVTSWSTAEDVDSQIDGYAYFPEDGNQYLTIKIRLDNTSNEERLVSDYTSIFKYVDSAGLTYKERGLPNAFDTLPGSIPPKGSRSGNVFFQIPATLNPAGGQLLVHLEQGPSGVTLPIQ